MTMFTFQLKDRHGNDIARVGFAAQVVGRKTFQVILQRKFQKYGFQTQATMMDLGTGSTSMYSSQPPNF